MAGSDPRFPKGRVAAALTFAQNMGLPVEPADRPTFLFADQVDYAVADTTGRPWHYLGNPAATVDDGPPSVQAVCGRKALKVAPEETTPGQRTVLRYELSFLPDAWAQVENFKWVVMDGDLVFRRVGRVPQAALFDLAFHTVIVETGDDV